MIDISAFSFHYDEFQDRIRLIGNLENGQQRIDFWLTRRLTLRLLDAAMELISKTSKAVTEAPVELRPAMAQFEHEQASQAASISKEKRRADHRNHPVEVLSRLDISYQGSRYKLSFFLAEQDEPCALSLLSYQEMHQVLHWIHRGAETLDWGTAKSLFGEQDQFTATLQ